MVALDEVCEVIQGQSPPGDTYNDSGDGIPFFQGKAEFGPVYPTVAKWCSSPTKIAESDDVLISIRAPVGPTNMCPVRACIGRGLAAIHPLCGIPSRYVLYALRDSESDLASKGTGSTFAAISGAELRSHRITLAPLPTQHRIVAEIERQLTRLDAAAAALKRVQANLKRYRASVLKAACEGRLVPTEADLARAEGRDYEPADRLLARILKERRARWEADQLAKMQAAGKPPKDEKWKAKYPEAATPDTSRLPDLSEGWVWATMPQLGELNRGKSKHRPRDDPKLYGGPYPFIQTGDVKHSNGRVRTHSQTYSELGLAQSRLWPEGTLCITIAANIAETGILSYPACFPDSVVGFLFDGLPTLVRFVELFLRTARESLERFAPATAQKNINLEILSRVGIPLPPLVEQERVVAEVESRLSAVEIIEISLGSSLKRANRLRQAILKRAFEGRLVPQDPNDEPAGALLERIRAERAKLDQAAKPAKGDMRRPSRRSAKTEIFA